MAELNYSDDALNVISAFHEAERMLYVEGDDDVLFWEFMLDVYGKEGYKVQSLDGIEELKKYIEKISAGDIEASAARDCDFSEIDSSYKQVPFVARTYGHSIENTLMTPDVLCKVIRSFGRVSKKTVDEANCERWFKDMYKSFEQIIFLDAGNDLEKLGVSVLGNNCTKFMKSEKSCLPDANKISGALADFIKNQKLVLAAAKAKRSIGKSAKKVSDFIRGHFLFSAALKYVNAQLRGARSNKSASVDAFFGAAFIAFESVFNEQHYQYEYYRGQVDLI